jgi:hypothetical protein
MQETCDRCQWNVHDLDSYIWKVEGHGCFCELCNEKLIEHGHFTEEDGKLYKLRSQANE